MKNKGEETDRQLQRISGILILLGSLGFLFFSNRKRSSIKKDVKIEEEWIPFHKIALKFLKNYVAYDDTIVDFVLERLKVPREAIPELIKFFKARTEMLRRNHSDYAELNMYKDTLKAIQNLEEQQKEG